MRLKTPCELWRCFNRLFINNVEGIPCYSIVRTGHEMWNITIGILGIGNRKHTQHKHTETNTGLFVLLRDNVPLICTSTVDLTPTSLQ